MRNLRLAYAASHPIQYEVQLLRLLSRRPELEFKAFYYSHYGVGKFFEDEFQREISWDKDLLGGYEHEFLPTIFEANRTGHLYPLVTGAGNALDRYEPDAVWIRSYVRQGDWAVLSAAKKMDVPVLFRGESHLRSHSRSIAKRFFKSAVLPPLFNTIDAFLAIGTLNREYYKHYGVEGDKMFSVPYCVDNDYFRTYIKQAKMHRSEHRANLSIPNGAPVVLFLSKLTPRKRPRDLIEAFKQVLRQGVPRPRPRLVFVGDGPLREELLASVPNELEGLVHLVGYKNQKEICKFYDMADIFVLPSEHEPWGLVVNEAMNAELPVIATKDVGSAHDLIIHGENGFRYDVSDVSTLAKHIKYLINNPKVRRKMGIRSIDRIQDWDFSRAADGVVEAVDAVSHLKW